MKNEKKKILLKQRIVELERENQDLKEKNDALQWKIKCCDEDKRSLLFSQEKVKEKEKCLDDAISEYKDIISELKRLRSDYLNSVRSIADLRDDYSGKIRSELKRLKKQNKQER